MYILRIKGVIPLIELNDKVTDKINNIIQDNFANVIALNNNILYISGEMQAEEIDGLRVLLIKLFNIINTNEDIVVKVIGDKIDDRFDYVINNKGIYLYKYHLIRELEPEPIMET